ncbi:epoxyqueuosine reductase [bacterium BMS3Bbin12]|nr:epoxyqueuosine reductase [bacterium BMS3Abin12]GBE47872.1 epoxyqueuosine reductase [bacterium BMS3Bbin12]GBE50170.1 epoxyqueuosine reductase [bacterium BMS3Bbin13]
MNRPAKSITPEAPARCPDPAALAADIRRWGMELGFQALGITDTDLSAAETRLLDWLARDRHGEMDWMARHGVRRSRPARLVPGTIRVISVRMDYWPGAAADARTVLDDPARAYLSRYALGRDYHKVLRRRLQRLAERIAAITGPFGYRVFTDSAPVLEKPLAQKAGLGWIGKHTNLLGARAGSWFFLGELYTDLPLPVDAPARERCGTCTACLDACPTGAILAPYQLDARRCIAYLTIELPGAIPVELRPLLGNRIYGCDDCQLACPWNRFAQPTPEADFLPRHGLDAATLAELFAWDEAAFLRNTEGGPIRRIGHERWLRNLAVALGNAPPTPEAATALRARTAHPSALVREHVAWALARHASASDPGGTDPAHSLAGDA